MNVYTKRWAFDALERAVKAFAGVLLVAYGPGTVSDVDIFHSDWRGVLIKAASVAAASVLMSVVSAKARGISPASLVPPGV